MLLPSAGLRAVRAAALTVTAARLFLYSRVVTVSVLGSGLAVRVVLAELAGIGLTVAASRADAVFGVNLVVLTDPPGDHDWQPARGALVVNASGQAPPDDVVALADQVFTDDRTWSPGAWPVTAGLGQVLACAHASRRRRVPTSSPGTSRGGIARRPVIRCGRSGCAAE